MAEALSEYQKEVRRWETFQSQGGMRPDTHQEFPRMMYKARKKPSGGPFLVVDPYDETFSNGNQLIVGNPDEMARAERDGWKPSPTEAIAHANGLEDDIAFAAAHRIQQDKRMSEKAQAEAEAADAATFEHLPEIKEQPKRRGRPPKAQSPAA